jgi:DNA-binding transcriptional ArsR family regulator
MARGARVADEAVRSYLEALQDPNTAVDWDEVEELAGQIAETTDPVRRVLLRAEWRRASDPATYLPDLEADFIAFASQWAQANRVSGDDFFYEGVPLQVLREAGMGISDEARAYAEEPDEEPAAASPAPQTGGDDELFEPGSAMAKVHQVMGEEPFTVNDLVERADTSRSTVRAVLDRLEELGRVEEVPTTDGGTRMPKQYRLVG